MSKKRVIFLANSIVDLIPLYNYVKDFYEIRWIVYYEDVAKDLKKRNVNSDKIYFIRTLGFLSGNSLHHLIMRKILSIFFKNIEEKILISKINRINAEFTPDLWITDTVNILPKVETKSPTCSFGHSIPYKRFFLAKSILNYDYIFLPGYYHFNRFLEFYKGKVKKEKLIVAGNLKVSPYIKRKVLKVNEKGDLLKKFNLSQDKKNILFATTYDAFGLKRFLPKKFGNQFNAIKEISEFINSKINGNFILKLHHYQTGLLKNRELKKIANKKDNYVFRPGKGHDVAESENVICLSDIIITDTSGVGTIGIFLGKKIIFLEPDNPFNWEESDIESNLRPGFICNTFDEVVNAIKNYANNNDPYVKERENFVKKIFANPDKDANVKIAGIIDEILNRDSRLGRT